MFGISARIRAPAASSSTRRRPRSRQRSWYCRCTTAVAQDSMNTTARTAATVPFAPPSIGFDEIAEVIATLESGWLTTGPRVAAFEQAFADYVGAPHAIAVNSCTAAL